MRRLFSCFEPGCGWFNLSLNWLSLLVLVLVPTNCFSLAPRSRVVIKNLFSSLSAEIILASGFKFGNRVPVTFVALFLFLLLNNLLGLLPYVFTATRHIAISLALSRALWVSLFLPSVLFNTSLFLAHLVPKGTPMLLVPFMVLIELLRNIIRPFTLGIRLAANMVAGHLILVLVSSPVYNLSSSVIIVVMVGLLLLTTLELAVSIIQSYVFMSLGALYIREVEHRTLHSFLPKTLLRKILGFQKW